MSVSSTYNEFGGYGGPQSIGYLVRILADASAPVPNGVEGFRDTLLLTGMTARPRAPIPLDRFRRVLPPGLPPFCAQVCAAVQADRIAIRPWRSWTDGPSAAGAHGGSVDVVGELLEARIAVGFGAWPGDRWVPDVRARAGGMRHDEQEGLELPARISGFVTSDGGDTDDDIDTSAIGQGEQKAKRKYKLDF